MTTSNPFTGGQVLLKEYENYINKTARDIARSFWKVEEEDVLQEITIFLWQKEEYFMEQKSSVAYIKACIRNVAINYALKQRNKTLVETQQFYYHADEVKELLPTFFSGHESWANAAVPEGAKSYDGRDNVDIMCDFALAYEKLKEPQKEILRRKYQEDEDFSDSKDRQALSRANRRFLTVLNDNKDIEARAYEGPGTRKVMSNTTAQITAKEGYEDAK